MLQKREKICPNYIQSWAIKNKVCSTKVNFVQEEDSEDHLDNMEYTSGLEKNS